MTIHTRNKIILLGIGLTVLLLTAFLASTILVAGESSERSNITAVLAPPAVQLVFAIVATTIFYFSFRKTKSPEMFFFIIFLISMGFDSLKASLLLTEALRLPPYYGVLLTRAVYFGRFVGILAVLVSGLFSLGAEYQRMELYLGVILLLALALSASVTIDMTQIGTNLLYQMGNARELGIISVLFLSFGVFNYVLYAVQNSSKDYALIALGLALVIAGREVFFSLLDPILLFGAFLMLIAGTALFGQRIHAVHLWS